MISPLIRPRAYVGSKADRQHFGEHPPRGGLPPTTRYAKTNRHDLENKLDLVTRGVFQIVIRRSMVSVNPFDPRCTHARY